MASMTVVFPASFSPTSAVTPSWNFTEKTGAFDPNWRKFLMLSSDRYIARSGESSLCGRGYNIGRSPQRNDIAKWPLSSVTSNDGLWPGA